MLAVNVTGHRQIIPAGEVGSPWPDSNRNVANHHVKVMGRISEILAFWHEKNNLIQCITGMALGADTIFAQAVMHMKSLGWPMQLIAAVPFAGQESRWNAKSQTLFHEILKQCDVVKVVCEGGYAPYKMQIRNEWMVDNSHFTLAIWNGIQKGGTWNCIQYARKQGKTVWHLHPQTLECKLLEV
jgi:uncharacterized phage-like protein YoqJ